VNLGVVGQSVERISIDYAITLLTDGGAEVRIETTFSIRLPGRDVAVVEPEHLVGGSAWLAAVLHEMITEASVSEKTGTLMLGFANGTRLEVVAHESYEAWTYAGSDGSKVVAVAGGGASSWSPEP